MYDEFELCCHEFSCTFSNNANVRVMKAQYYIIVNLFVTYIQLIGLNKWRKIIHKKVKRLFTAKSPLPRDLGMNIKVSAESPLQRDHVMNIKVSRLPLVVTA